MPLRVVVVDEEYRIAELLLQLGHWEMLNLEVADVCYDGIHALESIQNNKPDIVLTDIRMPGCDGLELIQKVKELGLSPEFIITSGYRHFEYAKTAIQQADRRRGAESDAREGLRQASPAEKPGDAV